MADAADARHEYHRGRGDARQVDSVVPGAADDVLMQVALRLGGVADHGDEVRVERGWREVPEFLDFDLKADRVGGGLASLPQFAVHRAQHRVLGMTKIDREEHPARDRVARVRADLHETDRRAGIRRMGMADAVDGIYHARGADE